ncbi:hypothetical protein Ahy_A08g038515 [Arachis hypogaea]|uniref:Aminotransferase-like plant mobile domain-containing protein n=1 Tax=Arachis hypogaea TaxID=3818 RepID=A0A445BTX0_ARAHY|nr:hypothetical protein Ahy_A08g038515 [Arachis hypogaea]
MEQKLKKKFRENEDEEHSPGFEKPVKTKRTCRVTGFRTRGEEEAALARLLLPRRVSHRVPPPDAILPYLREGAQKREAFSLKVTWLRDRLRQMLSDTSDPDTLRQYARFYIMLMIGGYLLSNKSNNTVHLRWMPFLDDFERCRRLSCGSAVLAWTYHSFCHAAHCWTTDIAGCTPLLISLEQQTRDHHQQRLLRWRRDLDRVIFDEFVWTPSNDPVFQGMCPQWLREEAECGTWMSVVPLICFNIVEFYQADRVKRQFNGEH